MIGSQRPVNARVRCARKCVSIFSEHESLLLAAEARGGGRDGPEEQDRRVIDEEVHKSPLRVRYE